ncbi:MAG: DNA (cytosine-5-)-methyltransferase [Rhizobiaceae bacterium]|nr:DNA (cytosine-5-)-methyltransferase [Rhizobiaceae bacterium]
MREAGSVPLQIDPDGGSPSTDTATAPTVLEVCAGAGGQAIGLHAAGFHHVGLVEIDADAAQTMRHNRPQWPVIEADLRGLDLSALKGVDLLAGGVPCQPYSAAGERLGAHDERDLFPEALRLVRELEPRAVMLENVTGTQTVGNAVNRLRILSELSALGYDAEWRILNGPDFGLPQKRRRAILVAFKPGIMHRFRWPSPLERRAPTVGEALYDLMAANGWKHVDAWKERANGYAPTLIGGSQKKLGIDLAQPKSRESWLRIGVDANGRTRRAPEPDAPADHTPKLTLEMMARLQDFPRDWQFQGSDLQQFRQIANAFPPAMAQSVGLAIMRALNGSEIHLGEALGKPRERKPSLNLAAVRARHPVDDVELTR